MLGWARRMVSSHPGQGLAQLSLDAGQSRGAPGFVAHRADVAHLGQREQPLVARALVGDAGKQIDVLHRRQPGEAEVAQSLKTQALPHHRMEAAIKHVFSVATARHLAEGEVLGSRHPQTQPWRADGHHESVYSMRECGLREQSLQLLSGGVVVVWSLGPPHVEVDDDVVLCLLYTSPSPRDGL